MLIRALTEFPRHGIPYVFLFSYIPLFARNCPKFRGIMQNAVSWNLTNPLPRNSVIFVVQNLAYLQLKGVTYAPCMCYDFFPFFLCLSYSTHVLVHVCFHVYVRKSLSKSLSMAVTVYHSPSVSVSVYVSVSASASLSMVRITFMSISVSLPLYLLYVSPPLFLSSLPYCMYLHLCLSPLSLSLYLFPYVSSVYIFLNVSSPMFLSYVSLLCISPVFSLLSFPFCLRL